MLPSASTESVEAGVYDAVCWLVLQLEGMAEEQAKTAADSPNAGAVLPGPALDANQAVLARRAASDSDFLPAVIVAKNGIYKINKAIAGKAGDTEVLYRTVFDGVSGFSWLPVSCIRLPSRSARIAAVAQKRVSEKDRWKASSQARIGGQARWPVLVTVDDKLVKRGVLVGLRAVATNLGLLDPMVKFPVSVTCEFGGHQVRFPSRVAALL